MAARYNDKATVQSRHQQMCERSGQIDISIQNADAIAIDHFDTLPPGDAGRPLVANTLGVWL